MLGFKNVATNFFENNFCSVSSDLYPKNMAYRSDEHEEHFHQDIQQGKHNNKATEPLTYSDIITGLLLDNLPRKFIDKILPIAYY